MRLAKQVPEEHGLLRRPSSRANARWCVHCWSGRRRPEPTMWSLARPRAVSGSSNSA